jgi:hypothetical protein
MATATARAPSRTAIKRVGAPGIRSGLTGRREDFEALGLLFGILGVLLVVVAGGATSPYGP